MADHLDQTTLPGPGGHVLLVPPVATLGHHLGRSVTSLVGGRQADQLRAREATAIVPDLTRDTQRDEGVVCTRAHLRPRRNHPRATQGCREPCRRDVVRMPWDQRYTGACHSVLSHTDGAPSL